VAAGSLHGILPWRCRPCPQLRQAVILAHYTFNSTAGIYSNLLANATPRPALDPFITLAIAFPIAALVLIAITKGRLGFQAPPPPPL
jgi:hypothetical protein